MTDDEKIINAIENEMCMGRGLWELVSCGELVRMFRKHLATPAPAQPEGQSADVDEMAAWMRRLVRALRKAAPGNALAEKALDELKRRGLLGDVLREEPDPLHVANERGEGEPDIEGLAETARNAYFGVSRRGPIRFDSIHPQSQQIWRNVVKAVLAAAPKGKP